MRGLVSNALALGVAGAAVFAFAANAAARPAAAAQPQITLDLSVASPAEAQVTYRASRPVTAIHFPQRLGAYRSEAWLPIKRGFRWVDEGDGERVERTDGRAFTKFSFHTAIRYRHLPKSYAPFSPFSDGSVLIHSGQFHACAAAPCSDDLALRFTIRARGQTIGVGGRRVSGRASFVSRDSGTNIFVGLLAPVAANGFFAIIDPGLPVEARDHLARSLPRAMDDFATIYGPLSFRPELYVSIDARPRIDGHISTQGGTLPHQIFMHFDGDGARDRAGKGGFWLDWFFAHEAAHLFQQDKTARDVGDDKIAWLHEGGADAMAALDLAAQGDAERAYVAQRVAEAQSACAVGLASITLDQATPKGKFDLHYQCGLLMWLALDGELKRAGQGGLHALNHALFKRVAAGEPWDQQAFLATARSLSVSDSLIQRVERLTHGGYTDAAAELAALHDLAAPLEPAATAPGKPAS